MNNPFLGAASYRADHRAQFFERDEIAAKLVERILAARCVTVYGPTGAGKSSLLNAAVIPTLIDTHKVRCARIEAWSRDESPLTTLARAMYVPELRLGALPADTSSEEAILTAAKRLARGSSKLFVVVLDQIEQLFDQNIDATQLREFFLALHKLAELPLRILRVVIVVREVVLARLREFLAEQKDLVQHVFRVPRLTVPQMNDAIARIAATGDPPQQWPKEQIDPLLLRVLAQAKPDSDVAEVEATTAQTVCQQLFALRDAELKASPNAAMDDPARWERQRSSILASVLGGAGGFGGFGPPPIHRTRPRRHASYGSPLVEIDDPDNLQPTFPIDPNRPYNTNHSHAIETDNTLPPWANADEWQKQAQQLEAARARVKSLTAIGVGLFLWAIVMTGLVLFRWL